MYTVKHYALHPRYDENGKLIEDEPENDPEHVPEEYDQYGNPKRPAQHMDCKNVWVWKSGRAVMLCQHDPKVCHARYPRAAFFCHAETQFVMQNRQHLEAQKLVMLSQHLWPPYNTPSSITSFQTQTFLQLIQQQQEQDFAEAEAQMNLLFPNVGANFIADEGDLLPEELDGFAEEDFEDEEDDILADDNYEQLDGAGFISESDPSNHDADGDVIM